MLLGVHCSVSGGLPNAFNEANDLGIDAMQIFTQNQRQWKEKVLSEEEQQAFSGARKTSNVKVGFSHASYLINLGSGNPEIWDKSVRAITGEIVRCHLLGLDYTVVHPGSAKDITETTAIENIAKALKIAFEKTEGSKVKVLLENTAGQGSNLGYRFEQLRTMLDLIQSDRVATCFDTCHAFAAGYDIRTEKGFNETMEAFDKIIGLEYLKVFHLNDSKAALGSRVDRHENIGKGQIGREPFKIIMNRFQHIPKVIETPKEDDRMNLDVLRRLVK